MGFFDFFNSEYSLSKKIYRHVNNLTATDDRYRRASQVLIAFSEGSLMMPRMIDKNLFQKKEKMNILIPYFSGATSLVGRAVELNDNEIDIFVIFFLVVCLCDGDYKRMKEIGDEYLSIGFSKEKEVLWEKGSNDVNDLLNQAEKPSKLFLRLNKLL